jgi:hypothetical protein
VINDLETRLRSLRGDWLGTPTPVAQLAARARRRRGWRWARRSTVGLVCLIVVVGVVTAWLGERGTNPQISVAGGSPKGIFVPATRMSGNRTTVALTFLDGTQLDVRYPSSAGLAQGGFVPGVDASISAGPTAGQPSWSRIIIARYGQLADLTREAPTNTYPGVNGTTVGLYPSLHLDTRFPAADMLGFQFGNWALFVEDYPRGTTRGLMTDAERSTWASQLGGHVTSDGYLVLDPMPSVMLVGSDQPEGTLGGQRPGSIQVLFEGCVPKVSGAARWVFVRRDERGSLFCRSDHGISIRVNATPQVAARVINTISPRNIRPGTVESVVEPARAPSEVRVYVENRSGVTGAAAVKANVLRGLGYTIVGTGEVFARTTGSTVACVDGFAKEASALAKSVGVGVSVAAYPTPSPVNASQANCIVELGY